MILTAFVTAAVLGPTVYGLMAGRNRTQRIIWSVATVLVAWCLEIWYVTHFPLDS